MVNTRIEEKYEAMSKTQKKIAAYVLNHITDTSYLNIKELAERVGAGEATIIRFCTFLGYKGFPDFKNSLQELAKEQNSIKDRLRKSYDVYDGKEAGIAKNFHDDMERLESTLSNLNMDSFFAACQEIILARKIYIIASRSASALGQFFQYYLNMTLGNVVLISNIGCEADLLCDISSEDVVIGITFNRYSKITVELFQYAFEKGANTMAITDSSVSPLCKYANRYFLTETSMPSYLDSFVAPLSLINAILTEIGRNRNIELEHRISELDKLYNKLTIFE